MVSINPLYRQIMDKSAARESGIDREKFPAVKFSSPGDKVEGKVLYLGDPWEAPNQFWEEGDPDWKKTTTTRKIVLEKDGGERVTLWINKDKMFEAIGLACEAAETYDVRVGHRLGFKFDNYGPRPAKGSPTMLYKARIIIAE